MALAQTALVVGCLAGLGWLFKKRGVVSRPFWVVLILWLLLTSALAMRGSLSNLARKPPLFAVLMVFQMLALLRLVFRSKFGESLRKLKHEDLIALMIFRFFVEVILAALAERGLFPQELTFRGINFDIAMGFVALPLAAFVSKRGASARTVVIVWNIAGLALLANIVAHAALALPTQLQIFQYHPDTAVLTWFPMQWLPFFLVPLALFGHLVSVAKLFSSRQSR